MNKLTQHTNAETAHNDPALWAPRLRKILDEQRRLLTSLDELSEKQREHIERDDTEALLNVLAQRQRLIDQLTQQTDQMSAFLRRWEELMATLPARSRREFEADVQKLAKLIETVARRDQRDQSAMERRRTQVTEELAAVSRGRGAVAAYGPAQGSAGPRYQDREG